MRHYEIMAKGGIVFVDADRVGCFNGDLIFQREGALGKMVDVASFREWKYWREVYPTRLGLFLRRLMS